MAQYGFINSLFIGYLFNDSYVLLETDLWPL